MSSSSSSATESSSTFPATEPVVSPGPDSTGQSALVNHCCDMCDFIGVSCLCLKIHNGRKHDSIPKIYTDCWWEMNKKHRLKTYQVFMNVILDVEEANLSKAEKITEGE